MVTDRARLNEIARKTRPLKTLDKRLEKSRDKDQAAVRPDGAVAQSLGQIIDEQRDNLAKADSVLGCLVIAMEYGAESSCAPYYPDVAQIARDLVQQSLRGLDAVNLPRSVRNKVKDEIRLGMVRVDTWSCAPPRLDSVTFLRPGRSGHRLRLHRRRYASARQQVSASPSHSTF